MGIAFVVVALPVLAIVLFAVFPRLNELSLEGAFTNLGPHLADPRLLPAVANSVTLALSVCAVSTGIAVVAALIRVKLGRPGAIWDVAFLIPFLIPPFTGAFAWIQLGQRNGFLEQLFGFNMSGLLFSFAGIVAVMALNLFPIVYFTTSSSLQIIGRRYDEVARVFGAGAFRRLSRIVLPLLATAIVSSNLLVFILSVEEFGTAEILGRPCRDRLRCHLYPREAQRLADRPARRLRAVADPDRDRPLCLLPAFEADPAGRDKCR